VFDLWSLSHTFLEGHLVYKQVKLPFSTLAPRLGSHFCQIQCLGPTIRTMAETHPSFLLVNFYWIVYLFGNLIPVVFLYNLHFIIAFFLFKFHHTVILLDGLVRRPSKFWSVQSPSFFVKKSIKMKHCHHIFHLIHFILQATIWSLSLFDHSSI
jgi:hypothetical protein